MCGFEHKQEAERFLKAFEERLARFGLELHAEKTRLIEFGRYAQKNRAQRGEGEPETFTFLGFTHRCGRNSRGNFALERRSDRKRQEAKLQSIKQTLRQRIHERVAVVGQWLRAVVNGYIQYHGVPGNLSSLYRFRDRIRSYWRGVLQRRSQTGRISVIRMSRLADRWLPHPRVVHPYPEIRFAATHPS